MSEIDHSEAARLVDAYFLGELSGEQVGRMRAHLRDCDDCRALYDHRSTAEQALLGPAPADRVADLRVLEEVLAAPEVRSRTRSARSWWPAFLLAPAAAVGLAIAFTLTVGQAPLDPGLAVRGGDAAVAPVGLGVVAVDPATGAFYDARRPEGVVITHRLRFSYSNPKGVARFLFLFGVDDSLQPYWYYPLPEEGKSVAIEAGPGVERRVLPYETELGRRHQRGQLNVVALFSEAPISIREIEAALRSAKESRTTLERIRWPGEPKVQIEKIQLVEEESE